MGAVTSLAWARLRHRPTRWLLICAGVAIATVLPLVAAGTANAVAAQALRHGLESLPPGERTLAAIRQGLRETPQAIDGLDRAARASLATLSAKPPRLQMLSRAISDGVGGTYYFGAADDLSERVRLIDGRMPASCTVTRCEVVVIGAGAARPAQDLGLVVVGRAERTDPLLFAGPFDPGDGAPLLVADGVRDAAQLEALSAFQRSYAWITPVDLDRVAELGVDAYLARSARASVDLYRVRLSLTAPDEVLRAEADRAQRSTRRFTVLGGAATALLLGFSAIGAIGLRTDHAATTALLRRRGATRRHLAVFTAIVATVPVAAGASVGVVVGAAVAAWQSGALDSGVRAARAALPSVAAATLAAVVVVMLTLAARRAAWRAVDLTVAVGVVVAAIAVARGAVTVDTLSSAGDPLLPLLPVIGVVCGGLLVGRAWPLLTAVVAQALPRRWLAARLGLVGAVRSPVRGVATAAFLAAATGIVVFAGSYQATLSQGAAHQAAFAVPLDARVRTGQSLRTPLDVAGLDQYAALGATAYPVVRSAATVRISASQSLTPELVGVHPDALLLVPDWEQVVGGLDAAQARAALSAAAYQTLAGIAVPAGIRTMTMSAAGNLSDVDISAWFRLRDGRDVGVPLTQVGSTLTAAVPSPATFFALTLAETSFAATRRQHRIGEGDADAPAPRGWVELGPVSFDGSAGGSWSGWSSTEAELTADASLRIDYALTGARVVVRASSGPGVLPVLVDPTTAAAAVDGLLSLSAGGTTPITARVAGVVPRFPATGPRFAIADERLLADALDVRVPGSGSVAEVWLSAENGRAAKLAAGLRQPPFDVLRSDVRQELHDRLASDPLARGAAGLLAGCALLAFLVGLLALVLLVVADRRDEQAVLYAWESDGVGPATLRLALFLRAVAVVAVSVPGGVLIGLLLTGATAALVRVTAVGTNPVPPLSLAVGPMWSVAAVGMGIAAGLVACALVAAGALRERVPPRPEEGLA